MTFRKEKKFRMTISDSLILKSKLISDGMNEIYPKRTITSQYFDTNSLKMFHESEEGIVPRKKIRARWYNKNNSISLETKISSIEGRFKQTDSINKNSLLEILTGGYFDKDYGLIYPSLKISYSREYYNWKDIRVTFDSDIEYSSSAKQFNKCLKDFDNVVELKTPIQITDDYIEKFFGHQTSRFSKYCRGILAFEKQLF